MAWPILAAAAVGLISGAMGAKESAADREQALKMHQDAIRSWLEVNVPDPEQQKLILQRYISTGEMTPELEQAVSQGQSEMGNTRVDPSLKQAQLSALQKLQQIGSDGGLTLAEQATQQKTLADIESQNRGRQEAIANQYAARGLGGSGLELVQQQMSAQDATNRASQQQLSNLGSARERALQAIMQSGQLAGNMGEQEFDQQSKRAAAQDAINRFNTQNASSVAERNAAASNKAQQYNLDRRQAVSDANIGLANSEQQYNKNLIQQQFENQAKIAAGKSGQYAGAAGQYNQNAQAAADRWAGIGSGIVKAGSAYGQYDANKKKKEDEE